jgi:hypothetical protein
MIDERENFPFTSELFCLFLERFPGTRPSFICRTPRLMTWVQIHMWGEMIPNSGMHDFLASILTKELDLLSSEGDHISVMFLHPYVGIDWRGYLNILFTMNEPPDDRGKI